MIKKIVFTLLLTFGFLSNIHAEMSAQMPNMNAQMQEMQKGMALLPFLTAPIESNDKLSSKDVELFMALIKKKDSHYADYSDKMEKGYEKAAAVLKKGVSFDTFVKKAIELSGVQNVLDKDAREIGYDSALDLTLKTTRIVRAMMAVEMEKQIAQAPKEQQEMMRNMMSGMMGSAKAEDIAVVKPYADELKQIMKEGQGT
ncbi:hypothetical protein YH65_06645 [Sulfurovum lithotrophicum]|uniref:Uncharacterized protein n=1 Tax=Sulfurovum lithotrophicum TaxID=206403 RepID=A0A7U4RQP9_9BACT|nr:hypothetical protein [Sulfurovum lithotrophicum]AKF25108.1 hypothetical protein YH65_06645 [Sulfurovum lithotrophicum]